MYASKIGNSVTASIIEITQGKHGNTAGIYPSSTPAATRLPWVMLMMHPEVTCIIHIIRGLHVSLRLPRVNVLMPMFTMGKAV
ncbi:hypothetical protein Y032_0455g1762 [Ancylostoma ceylanicum]|uniref:Uncharacterized protein n=1 Tax=Ancylostoma ceylanicum TaxID=53326 RepID=A0A016WYH8_9BILA|nr:hypothetical protein Y032_0455g1762 [Ancylostoma ceylanicum]